jgi:hypothetical protein
MAQLDGQQARNSWGGGSMAPNFGIVFQGPDKTLILGGQPLTGLTAGWGLADCSANFVF